MKVARNLFVHKVEDFSIAIQKEFIELANDSFVKDKFHSCKLEEFWIKMQHCYPRIGIQALNILVPFFVVFYTTQIICSEISVKCLSQGRNDV